jgi:hypothetical protein
MAAKTTKELIVDQLLEIARRIEANESIEEFRAEIELGDGEGVVEFIDFSSVMSPEKDRKLRWKEVGTYSIFDLID